MKSNSLPVVDDLPGWQAGGRLPVELASVSDVVAAGKEGFDVARRLTQALAVLD
jgi:hypothetical protein